MKVDQIQLYNFCGQSARMLENLLFATSPREKVLYDSEDIIDVLTQDNNYILDRVNKTRQKKGLGALPRDNKILTEEMLGKNN